METIVDQVYNTLTGQLLPQYALPEVEDAFAEGSLCATLYDQVLDAYARLRPRLGCPGEDPDVEVIIGSLLQIQRELSYKMFYYGMIFHHCA